MAKEQLPRVLGLHSTFVHSRASLQVTVVKRVSAVHQQIEILLLDIIGYNCDPIITSRLLLLPNNHPEPGIAINVSIIAINFFIIGND